MTDKREVVLILEFRKPVNFKNGYIAECHFPIGKNPLVMITDVSKDWQAPILGTKDIGNPKLKRMPRKLFHETFKITHIKSIVGYPFRGKFKTPRIEILNHDI
ncbi:MAG: hypothetical protein V4721_10585 [Bacteroidota bacterium]